MSYESSLSQINAAEASIDKLTSQLEASTLEEPSAANPELVLWKQDRIESQNRIRGWNEYKKKINVIEPDCPAIELMEEFPLEEGAAYGRFVEGVTPLQEELQEGSFAKFWIRNGKHTEIWRHLVENTSVLLELPYEFVGWTIKRIYNDNFVLCLWFNRLASAPSLLRNVKFRALNWRHFVEAKEGSSDTYFSVVPHLAKIPQATGRGRNRLYNRK